MEWKNEKKFADHRPGLEVVVGVELDGDIGILAQDGRRTGQYFSVIIAGRESLALAEHINQMYGYSGPDVDDRIATLTAERDELVDAIDAFNHIDRSGRHDTADLEQLNDAVEKCLRLINE